MSLHPEIVLAHRCELGEGPVWDANGSTIFWLDIVKGEIHQYALNTNLHATFSVGEMIGSIAPREAGGFIAGLEHGVGVVDISANTIQHLAHPEAGTENRFNDGKCDAAGRFWVGSMSKSEEKNKGSLYVMEPGGSLTKKLENVTISNGLAWNADNTVMYYIDTPSNYVFAFDFDLQTGNLTNQRIAVDVTHEQGFADGMTIDEEGMLWIAFYDGWRVGRYNPNTGKLISQVELPVANVTCCTFGGSDLTDLYITTASKGMNAEALAAQPHAGKLFILKNTGVRGTLPYKFK